MAEKSIVLSAQELLGLDVLPPTVSVAQAAKLIGVSRPTVYRAIKDGELAHLKVRGRVVIATSPLLASLGLGD